MQQVLHIGTRGSPLALWQANKVRDDLLAAHPALSPDAVQIHIIKTTGDRVQDRPLAEIGGKGLFTKELEDALLDGRLDIAVHSTKDMPTTLPDGLMLGCFLEREDPRDAFIGRDAASLADLPEGAVVGSASLRRQAQILRVRPDLKVIPFRGNVGTRLKKLQAGAADATLLAYAGLKRLQLAEKASAVLDVDVMLPAPAQGAICIECRAGDTHIADMISPLHHEETALAVTAERAFLAALEGNCRTPIAAFAQLKGTDLHFHGRLLSVDGKEVFEDKRSGNADDALAIGDAAGRLLRERAGDVFFEAMLDAVKASGG